MPECSITTSGQEPTMPAKFPGSFPHLSITTYCRKPPPVQVWRLWGPWGLQPAATPPSKTPGLHSQVVANFASATTSALSATPTLSQRAESVSACEVTPLTVPSYQPAYRVEGRAGWSQCSMPCTAGIGFASIRLPCKFDFHVSWCPHGTWEFCRKVAFSRVWQSVSH